MTHGDYHDFEKFCQEVIASWQKVINMNFSIYYGVVETLCWGFLKDGVKESNAELWNIVLKHNKEAWILIGEWQS